MPSLKNSCLAFPVFLLWATAAIAAAPTLEQLEGILDRAITMMGAFIGDGAPFTPGFNDNLILLQQVGAAFAGRVAYVWGLEPSIIQHSAALAANAAVAFNAMPSLILEACIFEIVTCQVNKIPVPSHVFEAFDIAQPSSARNFSYSSMLYPDGSFVDHWGANKSVPDLSQLEARMWFYYAADLYMTAGAEALHLGQMRLMTLNDPLRLHSWDLLSRVRARAARVARRGYVLVNAHIFEDGWSFNGTLLLDFHAFPSRPRDIVARPPEAQLHVSCSKHFNHSSCCCDSSNLTILSECVPYRRSAGGITPSGYRVDSLPYLVELDNWGVSATPGQHVPHSDWTWGRDEITWFSLLNATYRRQWLTTTVRWLRDQDPRGHIEMPGLRLLATHPKTWYYARNSSWDDAAAIADAWASGGTLGGNTLRAGSSLVPGDVLVSDSKLWFLQLQDDGDLVLRSSSGAVAWSSHTAGAGVRVDMLWNGNLVVVDKADRVIFQTSTSAHEAAYSILHDTGVLAVYWRGELLWVST